MSVFDRLAPYIQEYIYLNRWTELREVQVAACDIIFNSENNLLLSTGTASGKTEAAFLPALTMLYENPSSSVGILYISPLKALINDQFLRLNLLLQEGNISVCKWHGDASLSAKNKLVANPNGVLQITPESLESLLVNKREVCIRLFTDLRFIIIDEVHYFMSSPRGLQLLCQLERIAKLAQCNPRRIGLSATLADYYSAENWLNTGSNRKCITPKVSTGKRIIKLFMERFVLQGDDNNDTHDSGRKKHFEYLYRQTLHKKALIFTKSRAELEFAMANIRQIAEENNTADIYRIHHGSISAALREEAEKDMKTSEQPIITGATVTLELGMDIGTLDKVIQIGAPFSASSFTQRIGRCGRKGQTAELLFTFEEEDSNNTTDAMRAINWEFVKTIAIIQLYLEKRWVEPITPATLPYALLYHQTMSFLVSAGDVTPAILAQNVLGLSVFKNITQDDYRLLLQHLIEIEHILRTERGGLIIGKKAEGIISHYEFYSVFESPVEYLVKEENSSIGTVMSNYPVGARFALAGRAWECVNVNEKSKIIFVKRIAGVSKIAWVSPAESDLHTHLIQKMQEVLTHDDEYAYLSNECKKRLAQIRSIAQTAKITTSLVTPLSCKKHAVFPWIGTKQLVTLAFALGMKDINCQIQPCGFTPIYLEANFEGISDSLHSIILEICKGKIDKHRFNLPNNPQIPCKYNKFIPQELLTKQFIEDYLDVKELCQVATNTCGFGTSPI
jgi:ATP-dependent Lhr-like helicase